MEDERSTVVHVTRWRNLVRTIFLAASIAIMFVVFSVIVQAVLGDQDLPNEGGFWHIMSQRFCPITFWNKDCGPVAVSPSTSTSLSTSTSTSIGH